MFKQLFFSHQMRKKKAKILFEEIILTKNKFYSVLALNTIVEKNLILNEKKIIEYFETLKNSSSNKDQKRSYYTETGTLSFKNRCERGK